MEYFEPNFLEEALVVLDRFGDRAHVLAGGTLLGPRLRTDASAVEALVNVKRIRGLADIAFEDGTLRIGALATARVLAAHPLVREHAPLVALAAATVGAPAIRSSATIGGNVLWGDAVADMACALLACDAEATIATLGDGKAHLDVTRLLDRASKGVRSGAILTGFRITPVPGARCAYEKMQTRRAFEFSLVSAAALVRLDGRGFAADAHIALGGAAPTAIRAVAAERALAGKRLDDDSIAEAARAAASADAQPNDDARASAAYRRELVRVLTARALARAAGLAESR